MATPEDMTTNELARLVGAARPSSMTSAEWARRSGFTPSQVGDFLNHGKNITIGALVRITDAIGATIVVVPSREGLSPDDVALLAELAAFLQSQDQPMRTAFVRGAIRGAMAGSSSM